MTKRSDGPEAELPLRDRLQDIKDRATPPELDEPVKRRKKRKPRAVVPDERTPEEAERDQRFLGAVGKMNKFLMRFVADRMAKPIPPSKEEEDFLSDCAVDVAQNASPLFREWFPVVALAGGWVMFILPRIKLWDEWMKDDKKREEVLSMVSEVQS